MHDELKPGRLQHDVIVISVRFAETEHPGIGIGHLVKPSSEEDRARP